VFSVKYEPNSEIIVTLISVFYGLISGLCRCPCGLKRQSAAACQLGSRVQIPLKAWMFVLCVCCVVQEAGSATSSSLTQSSSTACVRACVRVCVCVCVCVCV